MIWLVWLAGTIFVVGLIIAIKENNPDIWGVSMFIAAVPIIVWVGFYLHEDGKTRLKLYEDSKIACSQGKEVECRKGVEYFVESRKELLLLLYKNKTGKPLTYH